MVLVWVAAKQDKRYGNPLLDNHCRVLYTYMYTCTYYIYIHAQHMPYNNKLCLEDTNVDVYIIRALFGWTSCGIVGAG